MPTSTTTSPDIESSTSDNSDGPPSAYSSYKILILSNIFFVVASVCYVIAGALDYQENKKAESDQSVSPGWTLLMAGAISFVAVGALDYWNTKLKIHILLILAGIFGVISSATSERQVQVSLVCNLLSAHLFLLESLQWIYRHVVKTKLDKDDSRKKSLLMAELGDFAFFVGAFMDVVLGYYYLVTNRNSGTDTLIGAQNVATSRAEMASAIFWLIASLFTITVSCQLGKQGFVGAGGGQSNLSTNTSGSMA